MKKKWTHQGNNLRVSTVKEKWKEGVEEDADKLDHLQSGQVPAQKAVAKLFCHVDLYIAVITCVSAFVEILWSLHCKIFKYTFLGQFPMKF